MMTHLLNGRWNINKQEGGITCAINLPFSVRASDACSNDSSFKWRHRLNSLYGLNLKILTNTVLLNKLGELNETKFKKRAFAYFPVFQKTMQRFTKKVPEQLSVTATRRLAVPTRYWRRLLWTSRTKPSNNQAAQPASCFLQLRADATAELPSNG